MFFHFIGVLNMYFAVAGFPQVNVISLCFAVFWAWYMSPKKSVDSKDKE